MQAHKMNLTSSLRRRATLAPVFFFLMTGLAGCAQPILTPLPDLKRPVSDGVLVPAEQKKAIDELAQKRAEAEAQAVKQIQNSR